MRRGGRGLGRGAEGRKVERGGRVETVPLASCVGLRTFTCSGSVQGALPSSRQPACIVHSSGKSSGGRLQESTASSGPMAVV